MNNGQVCEVTHAEPVGEVYFVSLHSLIYKQFVVHATLIFFRMELPLKVNSQGEYLRATVEPATGLKIKVQPLFSPL